MSFPKPIRDARDAVMQFMPSLAFSFASPILIFSQVILAMMDQLEFTYHILHKWSINRGNEHEIDVLAQGNVWSRTASTEEDGIPSPIWPHTSQRHGLQAEEEHGPSKHRKSLRRDFATAHDYFIGNIHANDSENNDWGMEDIAVTPSQKHASHRIPKTPSPSMVLFFMASLFDGVVAHSAELKLATYGSVLVSTLCSWIVLELPTVDESGKNVAVTISLSSSSIVLCVLFALGMWHMHLEGLEKHVFVLLSLLTTTTFCYIANRQPTEQRHSLFEGIPLFANIWNVFLFSGIACVREIRSRLSPGLASSDVQYSAEGRLGMGANDSPTSAQWTPATVHGGRRPS